jgi:hypothetical protein
VVKSILPLFFACLAAAVISAEPVKDLITARSFSGQFTAREMRNHPSPWAPAPTATRVPIAGGIAFMITPPPSTALAEPNEVRLEAETIGVSCERIKELFLLELGLKDEWRGRIDLIINSALPDDHKPGLTGICSPNGWNYELELPKTIREDMFVRAVVQTLFQELVNRNSGGQSTEVPFWLIEGFSAHLRAFNLPTFIIRSNVQTPAAEDMRIKGLTEVRATLRRREPLTFQELCWPEQSDVAGKDEAVYRSCAQLLFEDLLHLNDGPVCLRRMLADMPRHLNWQTAFLEAFHSHFARLLDVEKWWALKCVAFTQSDLTEGRTEKECWDKLQDALDVPVEVRLTPSRPATEARLTLQEVIMQWSPSNSLPVLQRTVRNLENLQLFAVRYEMNLDASAPLPAVARNLQNQTAAQFTVSRELSPLVNRYLAILLNYEKHGYATGNYSSALLIKKDAVRQLNNLDRERTTLRPKLLSADGATALGPSASSH